MTASKWSQVAVLAALIGSSGVALAEPMHPQTHHCKLADGSMDMKKTHKQCTAAKGTWAQDAPGATATPAPAPATPAPATPAPAAPAPATPKK